MSPMVPVKPEAPDSVSIVRYRLYAHHEYTYLVACPTRAAAQAYILAQLTQTPGLQHRGSRLWQSWQSCYDVIDVPLQQQSGSATR